MILSNQTGDPELHQRAIVTMGDTLGTQKPAPVLALPSRVAQGGAHLVCRFSGSVEGPSLCLQLAFDP